MLSRSSAEHSCMVSNDLHIRICSKHRVPRLCMGKSTQSTKIQSSGLPSAIPSALVRPSTYCIMVCILGYISRTKAMSPVYM